MNKNLLTKIGIFVAGAGIGAAVTWKLVKTKYEQITKEEIESVREAFSKRTEEETTTETSEECEEPDEPEWPEEETDIREYNELLDETGYRTYSSKKEDEKNMVNKDKPYVIDPEEFGECDYATITLTYYLDGVVTNDRDKILENIDELIGEESLKHFGDNEDDPDCVYVRDDRMQIDYEILKDYRNYYEDNE